MDVEDKTEERFKETKSKLLARYEHFVGELRKKLEAILDGAYRQFQAI